MFMMGKIELHLPNRLYMQYMRMVVVVVVMVMISE
jgi:hypothetical protein